MIRIEWRNDYLIIAAIVLVALLVVFLPGWMPVEASSEPTCIPTGTVGTETLYFCESDYADCVWDPSPALGAGVMDCD